MYPKTNIICSCNMCTRNLPDTVHRTIWWGRKLANLVNHELFTLDDIHKYIKNVFAICTDCILFANFFLANSLYLHGLPKFSPTK